MGMTATWVFEPADGVVPPPGWEPVTGLRPGRELAARGITADVSLAPPGKMCHPFPERFQRQSDAVHDVFLGVDRGDEPLTVWPDDVEGKTLVIEGRGESHDTNLFMLVQYVVTGPVAPCVLVDSQP
jgi:hypothetical protein